MLSPPYPEYLQHFQRLQQDLYLFLVDASNYQHKSKRGHETLLWSRLFEETENRISNAGLHRENCVLWISGYDGTYGEDFWELVSGLWLRQRGYVITRAVRGGDLAAYYVPEVAGCLQAHGLPRGVFLEELSWLRWRKPTHSVVTTPPAAELICIEAESSDIRTKSHGEGAGYGQALGYLVKENWYTHAFSAGPFCDEQDARPNPQLKDDPRKWVGLISCDGSGKIVFVEPEARMRQAKKEAVGSVIHLVKAALLHNLTPQERLRLCELSSPHPDRYLSMVEELDLSVLLDHVLSSSRVE